MNRGTGSSSPDLKDLTTLRVGGRIDDFVEAHTEQAVIDAVRKADSARRPLLVLGGGSNLLAGDGGFAGTVVKVAAPESGVETIEDSACTGAEAEVFAGVNWDDFVATACAAGWIGIEALSGIPGTVGATPIQNVGAYGQEVSESVAQVRTWDREKGSIRTFSASACEFGYRNSIFKRTAYAPLPGPTGRYVVLAVRFQLRPGDLGAPVGYADLAQELGIDLGQRAPIEHVRKAVKTVRSRKGMVLDAADHDTWSAGSFFTNPILDPTDSARIPEGAPRFEVGDGRIKTSAAWLISHAGFDKGFCVGESASLSTKHSLALTNRGDATAEDIAELARTVRDGVSRTFGIVLEPEPVRLGVSI